MEQEEIKSRYKKAGALMPCRLEHAVLNAEPDIYWTDYKSFFYKREFREDGVRKGEFIFTDCVTGAESRLFDAEALRPIILDDGLDIKDCSLEGEIFSFNYKERYYAYNINSGILTDMGACVQQTSVISPDGRYEAYVRDYDLYIRDRADLSEKRITFDGSEDFAYGAEATQINVIRERLKGVQPYAGVLWSHDSRKLLTYRLDLRGVKELFLLKSCVGGGSECLRPELISYKCSFPQDENMPLAYFYIYDLAENMLIPVDGPPVAASRFVLGPTQKAACWIPDDSAVYYTSTERLDRDGCFNIINPETGAVRTAVHEHNERFLNLGTYFRYDGFGDYFYSNFLTDDKKHVVWQSERSGKAHLYIYDAADESDVLEITKGEQIVTRIIYKDDLNEWVYYLACGLECMSDPYYQALCRVHYDGSGFSVLTPEDGEHSISFGGGYFTDTWSRVDKPPVTVLRKADGTFIKILAEADISGLLELGYIIPERFCVTASDGETILYGILIKPDGFDTRDNASANISGPGLHEGHGLYPLIDYIYGGMQCINVPKAFTWRQEGGREIFGGLEAFAKLGIAGIILDGLGTPGRGRKIHDVCFRNIHGCAGLKDHVYCRRELKEKYPFLDMDRVGVWGNSGGAMAAVRAMLEYPDDFQVAVASAGNHDQRMYDNMWVERYYGEYDPEVYLQGDNTALAANLKGHLFIVHGAMDDNVSMFQSLRLADALIRENKDFDFLILPMANHNIPGEPYFIRKKLDYFTRWLLNEEPPKEYQFDI